MIRKLLSDCRSLLTAFHIRKGIIQYMGFRFSVKTRDGHARAKAAHGSQNQQRTDRKRTGLVNHSLLNLPKMKDMKLPVTFSGFHQQADRKTKSPEKRHGSHQPEHHSGCHLPDIYPRFPSGHAGIGNDQANDPGYERCPIDRRGKLLLFPLRHFCQQGIYFLPADLSAENQKCGEFDQEESPCRPEHCLK